ncbi:myeloid zinc finger 1 isoform X2 [Nilaparvata lugens]|nr:myeloid zinc finger 1 isoform X2 [Nilaparvata lugens]
MENMHDLSDDDTFRIIDYEKDKSKENHRNQFGSRIDFECEICGRQFLQRLNLVKHLARHEKEKGAGEFGCDTCGETFHKQRLLDRHRERAHKHNSAWICGYCGKHTTTKISLTIHERIHTGVKPFICEWCGKTFRSKPNLKQHQARHTGERRHACPMCGKLFSRRAFVKTHLRVHTGERPYACDICQHRFTQVGDMRRHRRRHDVIDPTPGPSTPSAPDIEITDSQLCQLAEIIPIIIQNDT